MTLAPASPAPPAATSPATAAHAAADPRLPPLRAWLAALPAARAVDPASLRPASSDASFRRYFRVDADGSGGAPASYIVMDAPPPREDCRPFVRVAALFGAAGLHTPAVLAADLEQGFLLLDDLGATTYAQALEDCSAPPADLYADALAALVRLQAASRPGELPSYDRGRLRAELQLFPDWYVQRHLGAGLSTAEQAALEAVFGLLLDQAAAQAPVYVHRDYHSRNLMWCPGAPGANPGVLDFQDAVHGPITYDLVSLLRDAYVEWPEAVQLDWAIRYWDQARRAGLPVATPFDEFWRQFEWMGLQRTLKVLGIFARLYHRDGKDRYLQDLPRVLRHTRAVAQRYQPLRPLARLLDRLQAGAGEGGPRFGFTF